jgi:hypothetical protein
MELFPKKYDALAGRIAAIIYMFSLIAFWIYGTTQQYYYGRTTKNGWAELFLEWTSALFMIWGTVLLFSVVAGLTFSNRKYALLWTIFCLGGALILFVISYFLEQ